MGGITDALFSGFRFGVRITECAGTGTFRTIDTFKERYFRLHGRGPTDLEILGGAKVTKRACQVVMGAQGIRGISWKIDELVWSICALVNFEVKFTSGILDYGVEKQ